MRSMETQFQDGKEEVLRGWYINDDNSEEARKLPRHREPEEFVSLEKLAELGVRSWHFSSSDYDGDEDLKRIRQARGFSHAFAFELHPERMPNFEANMKYLFGEHLHPAEDETTYCLAGSGYYDVRDPNDCWIRIELKKGAMMLVPAGMYHRFTLDTNNYFKAVQFFVGKPVNISVQRADYELPASKSTVKAT